jgi:hypothetical protein
LGGCKLMNSRGGPPIWGCMLMNSKGGPPFGGLYVDEFQRRTPFVDGTISMDQAVTDFKLLTLVCITVPLIDSIQSAQI